MPTGTWVTAATLQILFAIPANWRAQRNETA
jgi:hypothetical protein